MSNIRLLDCTLRDGAYITNGNFESSVIKGIIKNLSDANIDMIEVGWLKELDYKEGSTYYNTPSDIFQYVPKEKNRNTQYIAMIDYGRYNLENLPLCDNSTINTIRLVFPREKFKEAIASSKIIKDKGYRLCLQAANTQSYSDKQLIELAEETNKVMPDSLSIVDTFGVMYYTDLQRIFMIFNNNLNKEIAIGFHSHNNLQMSFALSIEFINMSFNSSNRCIVIDSSLCGMGRGAGNACTELLVNFLNQNYKCDYDLNKIMDTIDLYMKDMMMNYTWGYSIPFCIAGQLGSHVNNIAYLQNTHKVNYKDMRLILESMPREQRKLYDYDKLEEAYVNYLNKEVDDKKNIGILEQKFKNKDILFIVPGKTIKTEADIIKNFMSKHNVIVVGINSILPEIDYDYLFFANKVRYNYAKEQNPSKLENIPKIITSNIKTDSEYNNEYIINYNTLMRLGWKYFDNTTIMAIRFFSNMYAKKVYFAGFDGYTKTSENSYSDKLLRISLSTDEMQELNNDIRDMLNDFKERNKGKLKLGFVTTSQFSNIFSDDE